MNKLSSNIKDISRGEQLEAIKAVLATMEGLTNDYFSALIYTQIRVVDKTFVGEERVKALEALETAARGTLNNEDLKQVLSCLSSLNSQ